MNKEEIERLAKYIADYIRKDVVVMFKRLPEDTTIHTLILEAVEQYDIEEQIRDKKRCIRKLISVTREACGGSQSPFTNNNKALSLIKNSKGYAFELGLGRIEKKIDEAYKILLTNQTIGGRIEADWVLCKILNQLDEEIRGD